MSLHTVLTDIKTFADGMDTRDGKILCGLLAEALSTIDARFTAIDRAMAAMKSDVNRAKRKRE